MVDDFNPEPGDYLYEQVAGHIEARIRCGELQPHDTLPAERQLARDYNVALGTARAAVRLLQRRGLVRIIKSKGSYVNPPDDYWRVASVTSINDHPGMCAEAESEVAAFGKSQSSQKDPAASYRAQVTFDRCRW